MRLNPRPEAEQLQLFYPPDYAPFETAIELDPSRVRRWMRQRYLDKRIRALTHFAPNPARALDVGCATGLFLAALRQKGWQVVGIEPNERAATYAREQMEIPVHLGTLEDAPFKDRSFELVTLWHVLEHLVDPVDALRQVRSLLVPGGTLALTVPNAGGWDAKIWGPWWAGWDAPRHLYHFTPTTLKRMLGDSGFEDVRIRSFTDRHGMWVLSAKHWAQNEPRSRVRRSVYNGLATLAGYTLTYPYFLLAERFNRSSAMTAFARRPLKE